MQKLNSETLAQLPFTKKRGQAFHAQISRQLRGMIQAGVLKGGDRLPSMQELAKLWGTNYFTVHTALTTLTNEGLIESTQRLGTFIRNRAEKLERVGIYYGDGLIAKERLGYYRRLNTELLQLFAQKKIEARVFIDSRSAKKQHEILPELEEAVTNHEIDALLAPLINRVDIRWLSHLSLPKAFLSAGDYNQSSIKPNYESMMDLALGAMRKQGAASIGVICPFHAGKVVTAGVESDVHRLFLDAFHKAAAAHALTVKRNWVLVPESYTEMQDIFGYRAMHKLWAQKTRPDALFVYPESVAQGVMLAILKLNISVPQALRLILHRSKASEVLCPIACSCVLNDDREVAEGMLKTIEDLFANKKPTATKQTWSVREASSWVPPLVIDTP